MGCVLCALVAGTEPIRSVVQAPGFVICHALKRDAPLHLLAFPTRHVATSTDLSPAELKDMVDALAAAYQTFQLDGYEVDGVHVDGGCLHGYRVVLNEGPDAGQSVAGHVHLHLLAGITMAGLKSDERPIGDHLRVGLYPTGTVLTTPGEQLNVEKLAPGMWVIIQTEDATHELRYFAGRMFYWRQENVHVSLDPVAPSIGSPLTIQVLWPALLSGQDRSVIRSAGVVTAIVLP